MSWGLLKNSLLVSAGSSVLAAALGLAAALVLLGFGPTVRRGLLVSMLAVLALPSFLVTGAWMSAAGTHQFLYGLAGTIVVMAFMWWPIPALALYASWIRIPTPLLEVEPMLSGGRLFRYLLWPAAWQPLAWSSAVVATLALGNFAIPSILQVKVLPAQIWVRFNTDLDAAATLAASWPLVVAPAVLIFWLWRKPVIWPVRSAASNHKAWQRQIEKPLLWSASSVALFLILISLVLPLGQVLLQPRTWTDFPLAWAAGRTSVVHSLMLAGVTASLCLLTAVFLWRARWPAIAWLMFFIPGVLIQIALIAAFNRPVFSLLYPGPFIVVAALALKYFAPVHALASHGFRSADQNLVETAALLGANRWQIFRHAYLPQAGKQLLAAAYVAYLLCLWDVESLILIMPPGMETISLRVFNLLHYGHNAQVSALCVLLLFMALAPLLMFYVVRRMAVFHTLCALGCVAGFSSCTPQADPKLSSQVFGEVQVIGTRGAGVGEFSKPRSLAVDQGNNVYVADMTGRVQKFSPDGKFLLSWQMPQTDLGRPKGMGRDNSGNILVNEPHYSRVNHFDPTGKLVHQWGTHGTNRGQLAFPRSVACNSKGELVVSEYGAVERVQIFSPQGIQLIKAFGEMGNGPGQFNRPEGLSLDSQDRIYVADSCNHRIQVFASDGTFLRSFGEPGAGLGQLSYPYDVAVGPEGRVYVCEFGNSRIQVFESDGQPVEIIGQAGAAPGQFSNPWSLAFDRSGNLYVADALNHRVQKFVRRTPPTVKGAAG